MSGVIRALRRILEDLTNRPHPMALVGGLAVSARVEPRMTRDVDLAVAVADDHTAEALLRDLMTSQYTIAGVVEQTTTKRLATARLIPPGDDSGTVVDLLFASAGIEPEIVHRAEPLEILAGVIVPVACIGDLLAMKILARNDQSRPQDAGDIQGLLHAATPQDLDLARDSLRMIDVRGFGRGRDLITLLDEAVRTYGTSG